ncbi:MAG: glycosyltransferase family 39 protein [Chitinophagales bacterium]|jgi:4-amino-4-deoxy-L-arabinose transferase-like glycosyltransferase|nr:glycosyltransferase family 39 protein [Chitinophagales bacterium]
MNDIFKRLAQFPTRLFVIVIGAGLFIPFLGHVHLFDWDEINFAESAREMLVSGNFHQVQINFQPFFEKPPLFMWMQALCMHFLGTDEFSARFPNAIFGILTMLLTYNIGKHYFSVTFGVFWALLMACSFLPFFYFKSGIIDPVFNYFIFLSLYWLFKISIKDEFESGKTLRKKMMRFTVYSAIACGLAVLTKGPVAILIIVLVVTSVGIWNRGRITFNLSSFVTWSIIVTLIISIWLSYESKGIGVKFLKEFFYYQVRLFTTADAGHAGPVYYHFVLLLLGCFPASILLWGAFRRNNEDTIHQLLLKRWMLALLSVVLILFSITQTKIVHYSSLCYLPITFLAAYYMHKVYEGKKKWHWGMSVGLFLLALLWASAIGGAMYIFAQKIPLPPINDLFAAEALKAKVYWNVKELIIPSLFLFLIIGSIIAIHLNRKALAFGILLMASGIFASLIALLMAPRVERYSQNAMIDFLKKASIEDCRFEARGFKSYAIYYYGQMRSAPVSDKTFVISKINLIEKIDTTDLTMLYTKNGFVFFQKK